MRTRVGIDNPTERKTEETNGNEVMRPVLGVSIPSVARSRCASLWEPRGGNTRGHPARHQEVDSANRIV